MEYPLLDTSVFSTYKKQIDANFDSFHFSVVVFYELMASMIDESTMPYLRPPFRKVRRQCIRGELRNLAQVRDILRANIKFLLCESHNFHLKNNSIEFSADISAIVKIIFYFSFSLPFSKTYLTRFFFGFSHNPCGSSSGQVSVAPTISWPTIFSKSNVRRNFPPTVTSADIL